MSKFALKYPYFMIVACLTVAIVGTTTPLARAIMLSVVVTVCMFPAAHLRFHAKEQALKEGVPA